MKSWINLVKSFKIDHLGRGTRGSLYWCKLNSYYILYTLDHFFYNTFNIVLDLFDHLFCNTSNVLDILDHLLCNTSNVLDILDHLFCNASSVLDFLNHFFRNTSNVFKPLLNNLKPKILSMVHGEMDLKWFLLVWLTPLLIVSNYLLFCKTPTWGFHP